MKIMQSFNLFIMAANYSEIKELYRGLQIAGHEDQYHDEKLNDLLAKQLKEILDDISN